MFDDDVCRRMGVVSNWLMTLSLLLLAFWWKLSALLFTLAWVLYGIAYVLDSSQRRRTPPSIGHGNETLHGAVGPARLQS